VTQLIDDLVQSSQLLMGLVGSPSEALLDLSEDWSKEPAGPFVGLLPLSG
jgi:hypothetical protein